MVDIFISYSKADRNVAETLFRNLAKRGYQVWWDFELYAGEDFHDVILAELNKAKAAIVIWSDTAVESRWVRGEADHAAKRDKLIPTYVPGFDTERVPLNFRSLHAENVNNHDRIVRALERLGVRPTVASFPPRSPSPSPADAVRQRPSSGIPQRLARRPTSAASPERLHRTEADAPASRRFRPGRAAVEVLFVAALVIGAGGLAYSLYGIRSVTAPSGAMAIADRKSLEAPPLAGFRGGNAGTIDASLQATALWKVIKREFPDWYTERVNEAAALAADRKDDAAIGQHMARRLRELRRQQVGNALSATQPMLKTVAAAFLDNLVKLRRHSAEACHGLIDGGEANPIIVPMLQGSEFTPNLQAQLTVMFEAIAEGRRQPRVHVRPSQAEFQMLANDLVKNGWTQADMVLFNDERELAKAPSEKVCQLVHDFFAAQLSLRDPAVQMKLIINSLRPVFAG